MEPPRSAPLLQRVDSLQLRVQDLDEALAFYRDRLGHELIWRSDSAVALRMADSRTELVLQDTRPAEIDLLVRSADEAASAFAEAGGTIVAEPFDIRVGRAAVVDDPWGNRFVLLDLSKGTFVTNDAGTIIGQERGPGDDD